MKNDNRLYVNIILKDGSTLHKAVLFKNKHPKYGEQLISYETKEEIEEVLDNKENRMIGFSTAYIQGYISTTNEIESYSVIEDKE